jgi:hypothetical protein
MKKVLDTRRHQPADELADNNPADDADVARHQRTMGQAAGCVKRPAPSGRRAQRLRFFSMNPAISIRSFRLY